MPRDHAAGYANLHSLPLLGVGCDMGATPSVRSKQPLMFARSARSPCPWRYWKLGCACSRVRRSRHRRRQWACQDSLPTSQHGEGYVSAARRGCTHAATSADTADDSAGYVPSGSMFACVWCSGWPLVAGPSPAPVGETRGAAATPATTAASTAAVLLAGHGPAARTAARCETTPFGDHSHLI